MKIYAMKKLIIIISVIVAAVVRIGAAEGMKFTCQPYLQNVGATEATLIWATDCDAVAWVELAPDDGTHFYAAERPQYYCTSLGKKNIGKLHKITLKGLTPATTYRYRVFSREVTRNVNKDTRYGAIAATNVYKGQPLRFTTADPETRGVRFAVVNDIHQHARRYANLVAALDSSKIDFYVLNGDMVNCLDSIAQAYDGFLNESSRLFATSKQFYMVRGNHETRGSCSQEYSRLFPTSTGNPYYAVKCGDVFMIMLDAGEDKPDSDIEYCGLAAFDEYRSEEAEWLRGVVASKDFNSAPVRIVFIHVPPIGNGWHGLKEVREKFIPVLNKAGIDLMLSGHIHRHKFVEAGQQDMDFPLLINSNKAILDIEANAAAINVNVMDETGKITGNFHFPINRSLVVESID